MRFAHFHTFHTSGRAKQVRNGAYPRPLAWRFACCVDDDKADKRVEKAGDVVELVERDQWATSYSFTTKTDLAGEGVGVAGNIGRLLDHDLVQPRGRGRVLHVQRLQGADQHVGDHPVAEPLAV